MAELSRPSARSILPAAFLAGLPGKLAVGMFGILLAGLVAGVFAGQGSSSAFGQTVSHRILRVVNDQPISSYDANSRLRFVSTASRSDVSGDARERILGQIIETLIDEELQKQEAKRLGIEVEDAEIQAAVSRIEKQNNMQPGQLIQMLTQRGIDANTLVDQIRATIAWRKAVSQRLRTQVTIGEDDIDAYLQNLQEKGGTEYLLGEIFIAANTPAELPRAKATAERLLQDMRRGATFTEMARQFSQAPTAGAGGDTGWVTASQLEAQIAEAVAKLQPGQVTPPIGVSDGYYLIALRDSRTFGPDGEQETVYDLRRVFLAYPPGANQQQQRNTLIRLARARPGLNNCEAVERFATQVGDPKKGDMGKLTVAEMQEGLRPLILELEPGKISQLYRLQDGGLVMMLCGKETRSLGLPTRDEVRENLLQREADIIARRYLRELRQNAIIQTVEERT